MPDDPRVEKLPHFRAEDGRTIHPTRDAVDCLFSGGHDVWPVKCDDGKYRCHWCGRVDEGHARWVARSVNA